MDNALRQRLETFPTKPQADGLIHPTQSEPSTLIKADISMFHDMPDISIAAHPSAAPQLSPYELGVQEGESRASLVYEDTLRIMETTLASLKAQVGAISQQIEQDHFAAVSCCLEALFPALAKTSAYAEVQSILQNLSSATLEGGIALTSHSHHMPDLERLCAAQETAIKLIADDGLETGAIDVQWQGGGAVINCDAVHTACLSALEKAQSALDHLPHTLNLKEKE